MKINHHEVHPYPAYQKSSLSWVEKIPQHWRITNVKRHFQVRIGKMLTTEPQTPTDVEVPYLKALNVQWNAVNTNDVHTMWASQDEARQLEIRPGDLLVCEGGEGGRAAIVHDPPKGFIFQNALHRVRAKHGSLNPYLLRVMYGIASSGWFDALNNKATIAHFTKEKFEALVIPIPPLDEQAAIVRYLDHADELISRYIGAKERLIALLEEQRQAVIHQAVTRGLDPNAPSKQSSVEWLADVPQHWQLPEIKQVSKILRGKFTHRPRNDPSLYGGIYPFIQTGDVAAANGIIRTHRQTLNQRGLAVSTMFPAGTLVMTIAANIGDVAVLNFEACFPDSIVGFVPTNKVERDFLYYLFRAMKSEFLREAPVNTQGNLNVERIGSRKIPLPSVDEQVTIVRHLAEVSAHIDASMELAHSQVSLIGEYRTRLIADVVTGQIDVRDATVEVPEP